MSEGAHNSGAQLGSFLRPGLNAAEAATAWAVVHFGGDIQACSRLQGGIGELIQAVAEPVLALDSRAQFQVLERWRDEDRAWDRLDGLLAGCEDAQPPEPSSQSEQRWASAYALIRTGAKGGARPWRRAQSRTRRAVEWLAIGERRESIPMPRPELRAREGFDVRGLAEMSRNELKLFFRQLGVYQLAELSHQQPRRSLVRLRQRLLPADRLWFDYCAFHSKHIDDEARARIHRLFGGISSQGAVMVTYLTQIGLYSVAVATQTRFRHPMRHILAELPSDFAQQLDKFNRRAATMPAVISTLLRVMLDSFAQQWREYNQELRAGNIALIHLKEGTDEANSHRNGSCDG